jgi:hypothetical protein
MNRPYLSISLFCLVVAAGSISCGGKEVGRKCFTGFDVDDDQAVIASPALECPERQCLHVPQEAELPPGSTYADQCTAECESDDDCERVPESPCQTGFTCTVPVTVGPFCCRKMCVCSDYLIIPEGGRPIPAACDPDNPENTCCNLPGRENLEACAG